MFPVPVLDHVVVNARERLEEAAALYERLGFTLTPRGHHTLGSINHLAIFGTDYLELIGSPPGKTPAPENMEWPDGLNAVVFGTEDAEATHAALQRAGVAASAPLAFSRPVALEAGTRDASFRTIHLPRDTTDAGRLYFCQHETRDLVWRDEWRHHANGVVGVVRVVISALRPDVLADVFARMFGREAIGRIGGGVRLALGLARVDIVQPAVIGRRYGRAAPSDDGRDAFMAALVLRTRDLAQAKSALRAGDIHGVVRQNDRIVVPASSAFGVALDFRD